MRQVPEAFREARELNREKGFTLIELLVVIAIIAILAAIAIPQFNKYRANAMLSNVQNMVKNIVNMASAVATSAAQNPACRYLTSFNAIITTSKNSTTATNCTSTSTACYVVAASGTTACDSAMIWDQTQGVNRPSWVAQVDGTLTLTTTATGIQISGGTVNVRSTYSVGGKNFGCQYNSATDTLGNIDSNNVCSTL